MATLFEYAVIVNEKRNKDGDVVDEAEIVVSPTQIIARDQSTAQLLAARAIPESALDKLDRVVVVVRPF